MNLNAVLLALEVFVYSVLGIVALFGAYLALLLFRRIKQKRFASDKAADEFLDDVRDMLDKQNYDGVVELCDSPGYWAKAVPQLILVAMANRTKPIPKLKRLVNQEFEREVTTELEYTLAWIGTCVRSGPMLGLLGTVLGIVVTFGKLAEMGASGGDPSKLAGGIGTALFATALGLTVAIPLTLLGALFHVRVGRLETDVRIYMGEFFDELEASLNKGAKK